jgi:predicted acylesterase/phospholipase RssA
METSTHLSRETGISNPEDSGNLSVQPHHGIPTISTSPTIPTSPMNSNDWKPHVLVLGPGGVKGFLELGALILLEVEGFLKNVTTYAGVSVGSIIALLLVAGYTVTEIISDAVDTNLFQDLSSINLENIKANAGLISNRGIKERLTLRLEEKFGFLPNLEQLYLVTGLEFMCVTMNLSKCRAEYLSRHTYPTMGSVDAVMLSMNIPLIFYKLKYRGSIYIDGAFANSYPVDQYDDGTRNILGIYITTENEDRTIPEDFPIPMYLYKIIDCSMVENRERIIRASSNRCRHLRLYSPTIDTLGLTMDIKTKSQLVLQGYNMAKEFLEQLRHPSHDIIVLSDGTVIDRSNRSTQSNQSTQSSRSSPQPDHPLSPRIRPAIDITQQDTSDVDAETEENVEEVEEVEEDNVWED